MSLINSAIECGVHFLPEANAQLTSLENLPLLQITSPQTTFNLKTKIVVVADGLSGKTLELFKQFDPIVRSDSRIGAGIIIQDNCDFLENGNIYMACGKGGYVGLVRLEDNKINVAMALDRHFSKQYKGPSGAATQLLESCNLPVPMELTRSHWTGTDALTRTRLRHAGQRLFIIGDASLYTEPFTGEGIAWALSSALEVSQLAIAGIDEWHSGLMDEWSRRQQLEANGRVLSKSLAFLLRCNLLRHAIISTLSAVPAWQ